MANVHDILTDKLDRDLIALLKADGRASVSDLARTLGLSRTTVQSRLERLERSKRIVGYTVRLSEAYERSQLQAFVAITAQPKQASAVSDQMKAMRGVRRLQSVSGAADMMAFVEAPSAGELDALILRIDALEGVEKTTSAVVLSTRFDR